MDKQNLLDWFRNNFIPSASDHTIAVLLFLYHKYGDELQNNLDAQDFIHEKMLHYKNTQAVLQ